MRRLRPFAPTALPQRESTASLSERCLSLVDLRRRSNVSNAQIAAIRRQRADGSSRPKIYVQAVGVRSPPAGSIALDQKATSPTTIVLFCGPLRTRHGGNAKIAAILVADIVGYSRLAAADEDRTLSRLRGCAAI